MNLLVVILTVLLSGFFASFLAFFIDRKIRSKDSIVEEDPEELLTVLEAATAYGVSAQSIYYWLKKGLRYTNVINPYTRKGVVMISRRDLKEYDKARSSVRRAKRKTNGETR